MMDCSQQYDRQECYTDIGQDFVVFNKHEDKEAGVKDDRVDGLEDAWHLPLGSVERVVEGEEVADSDHYHEVEGIADEDHDREYQRLVDGPPVEKGYSHIPFVRLLIVIELAQ